MTVAEGVRKQPSCGQQVVASPSVRPPLSVFHLFMTRDADTDWRRLGMRSVRHQNLV